MISLSKAGKRFGHKLLFEELDWLITPRDRIGIVGANGAGKSTLLKVLAGSESLDYGALNLQKGITAGYLPQDGLTLSGRTVFAEGMSVFAGLRAMEEELERLTGRMSEVDHESAEYARIADRFSRVDAEFRARDGYAIEAQAGAVLTGLGFRKEDWTRQTDEFSGGWQMRIALAKLLLQKPNLLLLDEPTNHLDLETRNWLEEYLREYEYAYALISHDRYFLDVTVDKIAEIWNKQVHFYAGNYEKYLAQKEERRAHLAAAQKNQQEKIDQLERFVERFRYKASKARQVQSRVKELDRIERIELPEDEKAIYFTFPQPPPSGRVVAEFKDIAKSYGRKQVFSGVDFIIERGDRIALVGPNGAGKSTLIKLLAYLEPLSAGDYRLGHNVEVDYFAQDQYKALDTEARILDDLWAAAPRHTQTELRNLLGCFLFSEDDVFKRIGVLSGGERNRYALAKMLLHPSNFLLLDEPTNHLDMRAKEVLLSALEEFTGTLVFVSHDRYFIDNLATRVFEIGGGHVQVFPGNYEDYLWRKQRDSIAAGRGRPSPDTRSVAHSHASPTESAAQPASGNGSSEPDMGGAPKRINPLKVKQLQQRVAEVEDEIAQAEAAIAECERALMEFVSPEETARQMQSLADHRARLEELIREWEETAAVLEANG